MYLQTSYYGYKYHIHSKLWTTTHALTVGAVVGAVVGLLVVGGWGSVTIGVVTGMGPTEGAMPVEVVAIMFRLGVEVGIMDDEEAIVVITALSVGTTMVEEGSGEGLRLCVGAIAGIDELIVSGISTSMEETKNITDACVGATDVICVAFSATVIVGIAIELCPLLGRSNRNVNTVQKSGVILHICLVVSILRIIERRM